MFWILGADVVMQTFGRMSAVAPVQAVAGQFEHKAWAGFAFYDLIFPLFVFIVGASVVFSLSRLVEREGRAGAVKRVLLRGALLYALGIFYSGGVTTAWPDIRLLGVLQRIALAYTATGLLFCFLKPRALAAVTVALLVGYWALLTFVPIRDFPLDKAAFPARLGTDKPTPAQVETAFHATTQRVTARYEPGLNLTNHLDYLYLGGRKYDTYYDPEGFLSTLPAIATCLLGVFAGLLLRRPICATRRKSRGSRAAAWPRSSSATCGACSFRSSRRSGRRPSCSWPAAGVCCCWRRFTTWWTCENGAAGASRSCGSA
jgi:predicted acyltransferase